MASLEGQPLVHEHHDEDFDDYDSTSWCGGCFRWRRNSGEHEPSWVAEKLRKVKEFSEVVAGPKWKTFIRKISSYFSGKRKSTRLNYDQHSYDLNFNRSDDDDLDLDMPPSFSTRFSVPRPPQPQFSL